MAAARVTPRTLAPPEASGAARGGMRGLPATPGRSGGRELRPPAAPTHACRQAAPAGPRCHRASAGGTSGYREEKPETWVFVHTFLSFECRDLNPDTCGS